MEFIYLLFTLFINSNTVLQLYPEEGTQYLGKPNAFLFKCVCIFFLLNLLVNNNIFLSYTLNHTKKSSKWFLRTVIFVLERLMATLGLQWQTMSRGACRCQSKVRVDIMSVKRLLYFIAEGRQGQVHGAKWENISTQLMFYQHWQSRTDFPFSRKWPFVE